MADRNAPTTLHSNLGRTVAGFVWFLSAGMLLANAVSRGAVGMVSVIAPAALAAFVAWAVFWAPKVAVAPGGLRIGNILREYRIDWSAVRGVEIGMALTISTDHGKVMVWSAPAPGGGASRYGRGGAYSRMGSDSGYGALFVRARWVEMHRFGSVPPAPENGAGFATRWYVVRILVFLALLVATIVTAVLFAAASGAPTVPV